jgi:hypothetical protein
VKELYQNGNDLPHIHRSHAAKSEDRPETDQRSAVQAESCCDLNVVAIDRKQNVEIVSETVLDLADHATFNAKPHVFSHRSPF